MAPDQGGAIVVEIPKSTQEQLDRIEGHLQRVNGRLTKLEEDRIPDIEADIHGSKDERRREHDPGLMARMKEVRSDVADLKQYRGEAEAVKQMRRWLIGGIATVLIAQVAFLTLLLRIAAVI